MQYIDHPDMMVNRCPLFKAIVPVLCQELPVEPIMARQLTATLGDLHMAIVHAANTETEEAFEKVNAFRQELLQIWADYCITSANMSIVGHGAFQHAVDDVIFQFTKTSLTHPVRDDLVMHAFSMAAFTDLKVEEITTADLLGEDCGVHYTMFKQEPKPEDFQKIETMVKSTESATFDDYLNVFN